MSEPNVLPGGTEVNRRSLNRIDVITDMDLVGMNQRGQVYRQKRENSDLYHAGEIIGELVYEIQCLRKEREMSEKRVFLLENRLLHVFQDREWLEANP